VPPTTPTELQLIVELLKWVAPMGTIAAVGWVLNDRFSILGGRITTIETKVDLLLTGKIRLERDSVDQGSGEHPAIDLGCIYPGHCPLGKGINKRQVRIVSGIEEPDVSCEGSGD
jgi:hypothetical protein